MEQTDGRFEVRRYPAFTGARTPLRDGRDDSFQRLFDFISGANVACVAYYDSPFIPGPLRRNEAMLRLAQRQSRGGIDVER